MKKTIRIRIKEQLGSEGKPDFEIDFYDSQSTDKASVSSGFLTRTRDAIELRNDNESVYLKIGAPKDTKFYVVFKLLKGLFKILIYYFRM